jgi:hypothetical protein
MVEAPPTTVHNGIGTRVQMSEKLPKVMFPQLSFALLGSCVRKAVC